MYEMDDVEARLGELAAIDPRDASPEERLAAMVGFERLRSLLELAAARVVGESDRQHDSEERHCLSTTSWLSREAGSSPRTVRARVRTATRLTHLDQVTAAVRDGRLSFDHAAALASVASPRVADAVAGAQDELVDLAGEAPSFGHWYRELRRFAALADQDGTEPDDLTRNRLRCSPTLDGVTHVTGTMTAEVAAVIVAAVEAKADELFRQYTRDHHLDAAVEVPSRATLRALALAAVVAGRSTGRAEVTLVVRDHEWTDAEGNPVPEAAAGVWGCDPDLWAVLVDHMGVPLDLGHGPRFATAALRRALAVRDGGCVFPGCDRPPQHCDAHHLTSPLVGGRTDLNEMVLLCRHHHHDAVHRRGWTLTPNGDGTFTWTTRTGDTHTTRPRHHTGHDPPTAAAA